MGFAAGLFAMGCGDGASSSQGPPELPPIPVHTVTLEAAPLPRILTSVGSLESPEMTAVASEIAGTVVELSEAQGERVDAGHVVVRLDDTEARADLAVQRAMLRNARERLRRIERLHENGVASPQQLDDARANFDAAAGSHRAARTRLAKHVVRAPFSGLLGLSQIDLGDYVDRGDPVVEISDPEDLELRFALPQRFFDDLEKGQTVLGIVGRCGPRFEGQIVAIDPRVDPRTRMVGVRAAIPNADRALHPGMAVRVRVVVGEFEAALLVPQEAIVRQGTRHVLHVVDEERRAHPRHVEIGDYHLDGAHVLAGVAAGDEIVVAGHQKLLQPGAVVEPSPDREADRANPVAEVGRFGPPGCETP